MGLLSNFQRPRAKNAAGPPHNNGVVRETHDNTTTHTSSNGIRGLFHHDKQSRHHHENGSGHHLNRRPPFGQWLKGTWLDILTMIVMGIIGLGVYQAHPAPTRSFPVIFRDGEIVYPQFAYPLRKEIIPIWAAAMLGTLVPIFIFLVMQIRIRSFWDTNNAIIGLLYSLITAAVFQVFLKWLIGGLRPHFLSVCRPVIPAGTYSGNGFQGVMFDRSICTGDTNQIDDNLESFPSGHSTAAFAGFVYLYLYLNAKLKVFANYHPAMWKLVALYAPILAATLIAGALTIDEFHNWYDCLAGAVIGTVMAFSAYRMVYASVWDFRVNHILLVRGVSFTYGAAGARAGGFAGAVFTRQVGWGVSEGEFGGAPFDLIQGAESGFLEAGLGGRGHEHGHGHGRRHHRKSGSMHGQDGSGPGHEEPVASPRRSIPRRPVASGEIA